MRFTHPTRKHLLRNADVDKVPWKMEIIMMTTSTTTATEKVNREWCGALETIPKRKKTNAYWTCASITAIRHVRLQLSFSIFSSLFFPSNARSTRHTWSCRVFRLASMMTTSPWIHPESELINFKLISHFLPTDDSQRTWVAARSMHLHTTAIIVHHQVRIPSYVVHTILANPWTTHTIAVYSQSIILCEKWLIMSTFLCSIVHTVVFDFRLTHLDTFFWLFFQHFLINSIHHVTFRK